MTSEFYRRYMKSIEWSLFKWSLVSARGPSCEACGEWWPVYLDGHHQTYARLGHEDPADVVLLCRRCHDEVHDSCNADARELILVIQEELMAREWAAWEAAGCP
jgi:5-methylcytosine-specific restriction endonuclease McrA